MSDPIITAGHVTVAGRSFRVCRLSQEAEQDLWYDLRRLAGRQLDPVAAVEPILDRLRAQKKADLYAGVLANATELAARRVQPGDDAVEEARRSLEGIALELWHRSGGVASLEEIGALITAANSRQVSRDVRAALRVAADDPKATP